MPLRKLAIGLGVIALGLVCYGAILIFSPLPLQVMDRDKSGTVSFFEAMDALDIGQRAIAGKANCTEYFWLKDGLPAYESCTEKL